ncbi:MAG TPA: putative Ig domain-containing protein [Mucilaginibacter sp.]|nr:putative Ig domain-containing protein [Mucilaginibacter sp.]
MNKIFVVPTVACLMLLTSVKSFAQNTPPLISYSPASSPASPISLTAGVTMTAMTPANAGGVVSGTSYGTAITIGSAANGLSLPYGAVSDPSGNIYVVNQSNTKGQGSVSKYNSSTGTWSTFQSYTQNTGIKNPSAIAVDASGNVYVLNYNSQDNGNAKSKSGYVTEYTSAGVLVGSSTGIIAGLGPTTGIAINNTSGNLDIAEESANSGFDQIEEYTTSGALNFTLSDPTHLPNPVNVATDNAGNIYVLDNTSKDVVKYSSTGTYLSTLINSGLTNPLGLYVDGSGNIYVSDSGVTGTNSVKVYSASGTFIASLTGLTDPEGMTTDVKGNLYVTDHTNNTVTEYQPTGGYYISGKLPAGLSFDNTTGTISGTPVAAFAATTYTITAYNTYGNNSTTVTLSCVANPTLPTIYYDPSINVYTLGNTITTLTPNVTNMSAPPAGTYTYILTGTLPAGLSFSTSTGAISGKPTGATPQAATLYSITATNTVGSATTTVSIATVIADYWTGAVSIDWNTGGNWSTGKVPTSTDYASIGEIAYAKHGFQPTVSSAENPVVGYLALGATTTPTITIVGSLTVNNIFTADDNSTPTLATTSTGNVIMPVSSVVEIQGSGALTINSGVTFTLQSNASGSASVDAITGSGSITGKVSVQRYMTAQRGYRLMASPVNYSGTTDANSNLTYSLNYVENSVYIVGTTGTTGGFDKTGNPTLYLYREDVPVNNTSFITGNYRGISNLPATPTYSLNNEASTYTIPASNGFLFYYRGSRKQMKLAAATTAGATATNDTLTATGYLNQGQIVFRDWYTPTSASPGFSNSNAAAKGFNLVANPYACTIDLDTYNTTTSNSGIYAANISQYIYELNPKTLNYDTYKANSGGAIYTNNGGRYIASGQGFFILATGTGGELIFNETAKHAIQQVTGTSLFMALKAPLAAANVPAKPLQMLRLEMALDTVNKDDVMIMFDENAKSGYDFNEDALYRTGSGKVSLGSISNDNELLAINTLPLTDGVTIPLKIAATGYGNYTMNLKDMQGVSKQFDIWLKDRFTGDSVNMRNFATYNFSITADTSSHGSKRFSITMRVNPAMAYKLLSFNGQVSGKNTAQLTWTTQNEFDNTNFTIERSNDGGKTFTAIGGLTSTGAGAYDLFDRHALNGDNIYVLKSVDITNNVTFSSPVDIQFNDNATSNVTLYPNPAANNVNLAISPKSQGSTTYDIRITSSTGLVVKHTTVSGTNWQGNVNDLFPGTYLVQVTDAKNNELIGETKLIKL